jgi:hypothetical protein
MSWFHCARSPWSACTLRTAHSALCTAHCTTLGSIRAIICCNTWSQPSSDSNYFSKIRLPSQHRFLTILYSSPYQHHHHWLYNSVQVLASLKSRLLVRLLLGFITMIIFMVWGCQPHAQPPTWRTRVPLLVWAITFDLSDKWDPASSYTTAVTALSIIWPRKPRHYVKVGIPSVQLITFSNIRWNVTSVVDKMPINNLKLHKYWTDDRLNVFPNLMLQ